MNVSSPSSNEALLSEYTHHVAWAGHMRRDQVRGNAASSEICGVFKTSICTVVQHPQIQREKILISDCEGRGGEGRVA